MSMARMKPTGYERQRRFGAKTRTGCTTCKARHLKCPEEKPICSRCSKSGRECYYDSAKMLPLEAFENETERELFQHFREKTVNQWSGLDDYPFWNGPILQATLSHPEIRHVIIAIAARHESIERGLQKNNGLSESAEYAMAVEQSNKAIALLRDPSSNLPVGVLIISCILFTIFESLQDDQIPIRYIKTAMDLIDTLSTPYHEVQPIEEMNFLRAEIFPMLARLCQRFFTGLDHAFALKIYLSTTPRDFTPEPLMPPCFSSLLEANTYLDKYRSWAHMNTSKPLLPGKPLFGPEAKLRLDRLTNDWNKALHTSFSQSKSFSTSSLISHFHKDVALLKAHQKFILLRLQATVLSTESDYDALDPDFREMISLYQLGLSESNSSSRASTPEASSLYQSQTHPQQPYNFGLSAGILEPLYFTATKCRDPTLRREVIALLRSTNIPYEGSWNPALSALMAQAAIELEEESLSSPPKTSADIPLGARIIQLAVEFSWRTSAVTLKYHRCAANAPMQMKHIITPSTPPPPPQSEYFAPGAAEERPDLILGRGYCSFLVDDSEEYYSLTPETHSFGQFV